MFSKRLIIFLILIAPLSQACGQDIDRNGNPIPPRSPLVLLPNYKLEILKGIDTDGARIWKKPGVEIEYAQGMYLEDATAHMKADEIVWKQEQVINKQKVQCFYTKSHDLIVSFPSLHAYFSARIHNQQELTDMLLMVVTYNVDGYPVRRSARSKR
jgi:hypothetical protein